MRQHNIFEKVLIVSGFLLGSSWIGHGQSPEVVTVGSFDTEHELPAINLMRANAEIAVLEAQIKPLQDQIDALRKLEEPCKQKMVDRIGELCKLAKVPDDAIKAGQCGPKPQVVKKDGKDFVEMIWTKPVEAPKASGK